MEKRDARMLGQQAQEEVRRQAVKLLKAGHTRVAVAAQLDVSRQHVAEWWLRYQTDGWSALKQRKRGVVAGTSRKLTPDQEAEVRGLITDKMPDQLKLPFTLWTREAVRQLIKERYGVDFALQSMSVVLRRWGFTPQRPVKRAYEQRPAEVKRWLDETYPTVKARAQAVYACDTHGVESLGYRWSHCAAQRCLAIKRYVGDPATYRLSNNLRSELTQLIGQYETIWVRRSRVGGLHESSNILRHLLEDA